MGAKKGIMPKNLQMLHKLPKSELWRKRMSDAKKGKPIPWTTGEKNHKWKGDKAGYQSKHKWIRKWYGQPTTCEHCQTGNLISHEIHWANISGEFKRERTDWLRLCRKCHCLFDRQRRNKRKEIICPICGKKFITYLITKKYCSVKCKRINRGF